MTRPVKTARRYQSPLRTAQAAATRRQVIDAAARLFEREGYVASTVAAIADEAGVSAKTVYLAFESKSGLLRALWDLHLKGDESDAPVADRAWYVEVLEEPDAERQLRRYAHHACVVKQRIAPVLRVIRDGAPVDADVSELWELINTDFHANQRAIVESIAAKDALADELTVDTATDVLWTLNHPDTWLLLVGRRGWAPARFETWLADTCCSQLLRAG
jgi:AcrR family transcriptional regulator